MRKILALIGLISSIYGANEKCTSPVCLYVYRGAMSGELILVNNTQQKAKVTATVYLNNKTKGFIDLVMEPQTEKTLIRDVYDDDLQKTNGGALWFKYTLEAKPKEEKIKEVRSSEERKQDIKIEMH